MKYVYNNNNNNNKVNEVYKGSPNVVYYWQNLKEMYY
jgi:hypothetical protein